MSHVSKIELEIKDLHALKKACERLEIEFVENQRTYKWYGRLIDKDSIPVGMNEQMLGKCEHAIHVKQSNLGYEVGVVKQNDHYIIVADYWDAGLKRTIGNNGCLLKQAYTAELVKSLAKKRNWMYSEKKIQDSIQITLCAA